MLAVEQLGQRQVEAGVARGPVSIETQKQVPPGLAAVDGDDERVAPARRVVGVGVGVADEDPVLDAIACRSQERTPMNA